MSEPSSHDSHHPFAEIETILSAMVDGQLQPEQRARLSTLLRGNPAAQAFYRDYLAIHVALEFRYGSPATPPVVAEESLDQSTPLPDAEQSGGSRYPFSNAMILPSLQEIEAEAAEEIEVRISLPPPPAAAVSRYQRNAENVSPSRSNRAWAIAALVALVATVALTVLVMSRPKPVVAAVSAQVDAQWSADFHPTGDLRAGQHLTLTAGYAELLFVSGAKVIIQAPADFTLESRTSMLLSSGKLAATVIGGGFVVKTPSAAVTDLGTQFGVSIAADQTTRIDVFKGSVETALAHVTTAAPQTLIAGQAADVLGNHMQLDPEGAQPQHFIRSLDGLIARGDLVADLRPDLAPNAAAWTNHATGPKSVGEFAPAQHGPLAAETIDGPVGTPIPALHLSQKGTPSLFSAKTVPADIAQSGNVSVEAWLKPDAPLGPFNAVATWGESKIGAQRDFLYGTITPFVGDYADLDDWGTYRPAPRKWHYVVWVYREESQNMTVYVDGQQVKTGKITLHTSLSPLTLGAGPDPQASKNFSSDPLNGYLGAFRVETGILSTSDIQHNFACGMPTDNAANAIIKSSAAK